MPLKQQEAPKKPREIPTDEAFFRQFAGQLMRFFLIDATGTKAGRDYIEGYVMRAGRYQIAVREPDGTFCLIFKQAISHAFPVPLEK